MTKQYKTKSGKTYTFAPTANAKKLARKVDPLVTARGAVVVKDIGDMIFAKYGNTYIHDDGKRFAVNVAGVSQVDRAELIEQIKSDFVAGEFDSAIKPILQTFQDRKLTA